MPTARWDTLSDAERSAIQHSRWLAAAAPLLRERLPALGQVRVLAHGEALHRRGDASDALWCVLVGAIRITSVSEAGREAVLSFIEPFNWFGEIGLIDGGPRTHDGVAEGATRVFVAPAAALHALLNEQPQLWRDVALLVCAKLRLSFAAIEDMSLLPAGPRLARRLEMLAQGAVGGADTAPRSVLHIHQDQLAAMLALSRQTVNQELKRLQAAGVVDLAPGEVRLLNPAALAEWR
ncbi:Crp/Fnr family transcriptional regulator [Piscinibacterium candidicorallinum]|uniref:Crp/Fnr family transcriptional regulator n=1 Tax=Piscinibacterium candidicorallinum TaxID=1793872 RepID=A0ABV7H8W2_9BURK